MHSLTKTILFITTTLLLAGCFSLNPTADKTRYFQLRPTPRPTGPVPLITTLSEVALVRIQLPSYINRPNIPIRVNDTEIRYSENNRWAEILENNITHVIAENLAIQLYKPIIFTPPWNREDHHDFHVFLTISEFITQPSKGLVILEATYEIRNAQTKELAVVDFFSTTVPIAKNDLSKAIPAMNEALYQLSQRISETIPQPFPFQDQLNEEGIEIIEFQENQKFTPNRTKTTHSIFK